MIRTCTPTLARRSSLRAILLFALCLAAAGAGLLPTRAAAGPGPSGFFAIYQLRFLGLSLGKAKVHGNLNGPTYMIQGRTKLSFLKGLLFELKLGAGAWGKVTADGPRPSHYELDFETKKNRKGRLTMAFQNDAVSHVATKPPFEPGPKAIPLEDRHVRGVLDPLSAMFLAGKTVRDGLDPQVCSRRLPVFDGHHRFDVQLSYIRSIGIQQRGKGGYVGPALECGATYIPIAGHRPDQKGVAHMARTTGIRVWLIALPQANRVVPYRVVVPTPWGEATATARFIQLDWNGKKKVALVR